MWDYLHLEFYFTDKPHWWSSYDNLYQGTHGVRMTESLPHITS